MGTKTGVEPREYKKISLPGDPPGRRHHAFMFSDVSHYDYEKITPGSRLPKLLTWTPTGHGWVSGWDLLKGTEERYCKKMYYKEVILLVPRSFWAWYIPEFIRAFTPLRFFLPKDPKDLFYLEVRQ